MTRDTTTGTKKEVQIEEFLRKNSSESVYPQANVGRKRNGGIHYVDILLGGEAEYKRKRVRPLSKHKGGYLISIKNQTTNGSKEECLNFEAMKLHHTIQDYGYDGAVIVLCGNTGWHWKHYFLGEEYQSDMKKIYPQVSIVDEETFMSQYAL